MASDPARLDRGAPTTTRRATHSRCLGAHAVPLALAGALALLLWGQFLQPHGDFYEFRETGFALVRGAVPPTLKRSPAWPVLIAVLGALPWHWVTEVPAEQAAAQTLNGLLLVGIALVFHRLARRWAGRAADGMALLLLLTPPLWWAAAGALLEPLLLLLVLLTCERSAAGGRGRYLAASGALLVRPDCAGILLGVALADLLRKRPWPRVAALTAAAAGPAAGWLLLTLALWGTHSRDHYLTHLRFDVDGLETALRRTLECLAGSRQFMAAQEVREPAEVLTAALPVALAVLAVLGVLVILRRGAIDELAAPIVFAVVYFAGVAAFKFSVERYYLPLAMIALLLAAPGSAAVWECVACAVAPARRAMRVFVGLALTAVLILLLAGEYSWWTTFHPRDAATVYGVLSATVVAGLATAFLPQRSAVSTTSAPRPAFAPATRGRRVVLGLALLLLASSAARQLPVLFAEHDRVPPLVAAARWSREHLRPPARVLSGVGGLLALYAAEDASRFPGFERIQAETWPEIVHECRSGGVGYILWYADFFGEQGEFYIRQWRLDRFKRLDLDPPPAEIEVIARFAGERPAWIGRIRDDAETAGRQ